MLTLGPLPLSAKARELRQVFDATFAVPPPPPAAPVVALLLVRVGGELTAVRRAEMTGFVRGDAIALTPGHSPAFLGLADLRNGLYPVWSLAGLLGRPAGASGTANWLVLAEAGGALCAFACETFEQMIFVPEAAVVASARREAPAVVPWGPALVPVVDLPGLQAGIWKRKEPMQPRKTSP